MLGLFIFCVLISAIYGYWFFVGFDLDPKNDYFASLLDSFVNLFVLTTTSNYPDMQVPYYTKNGYTFFFFFFYIMFTFIYLMNLLFSVVYEAFKTEDIAKFEKLYKQKRMACEKAFELLGMLLKIILNIL